MERKQLAPGVCITTLDASKFNRCRITLHLRFPAKRESATDAAVLALVLERGYAVCPDMTALSRRLAELYGADLGVDLASAGTDRVLSADICGIKDAYALAGENLTAAYADIVFGTIFDPYLVDGAFDPEAVRIETETQARRLEAEFNSKRLYCVRQARRKFYGDTAAGIELGGYPGELVNVTVRMSLTDSKGAMVPSSSFSSLESELLNAYGSFSKEKLDVLELNSAGNVTESPYVQYTFFTSSEAVSGIVEKCSAFKKSADISSLVVFSAYGDGVVL